MNWRRLLPFLFTVGAMVAGVTSILVAASGDLVLSAKLIMLSMILDGLDGHIARMIRGTSAFGADLDTLVDIISFGIAPAFLAWQAALSAFGVWGVALTCGVVVSGACRLARFRVTDPDRGQRGYLGLPITVMGGWLAMIVLIAESDVMPNFGEGLTHGPLATLVWTVTVMFALLQVSHVRYTKPTKIPPIFIICLVLVTFLFLQPELAVASALAICCGMFFYAFISPFLPRHDVVLEIELDDGDEDEPIPVRQS